MVDCGNALLSIEGGRVVAHLWLTAVAALALPLLLAAVWGLTIAAWDPNR